MNKEETTENWMKAVDGIAAICEKIGDPLTESQRVVISGAIASWFDICEKIGMERAGEMLSDALQSDLEHGVKWLNENAAKDFHDRYPELSKVIGEINSI